MSVSVCPVSVSVSYARCLCLLSDVCVVILCLVSVFNKVICVHGKMALSSSIYSVHFSVYMFLCACVQNKISRLDPWLHRQEQVE